MDIGADWKAVEDEVSLDMIGHDFKSLVNTVVCAADLLALELHEKAAREAGGHDGPQYADIIRLASADMMLLVNSIMHLGDAHKIEEHMSPRRVYDMHGEMLKVLAAFSTVSMMKEVRIELDVDPNIPHVVWDMDKLRIHVINNVVSNALRHSPAGGRVLIRVADDRRGMVTIRISDTGPGISPTDRERVFQKCWHGVAAKTDGLCSRRGLGLFNAMLVVRAHGGSIAVVDDHASSGATFQIDLPYVGVVVSHAHAVESNVVPFIEAQAFT